MKFYAVKKGRKKGIFKSWSECKKQIDKFSGAEFKSFEKIEDAYSYLNNSKKTINQEEKKIDFYVDGSFNSEKNIYGSGIVVLKNNKIIEKISISGKDKDLVAMNNVAGELNAAIEAFNYAIEKSYKEINLYFDYIGIEKWATKEWKANKLGTKKYQEIYDNSIKKIKINFIKVKAHSGNKYNDMADMLAKEAILKDNNIINFNNKVFEEIKKYKNTYKLNILYKDYLITEEKIKRHINNIVKNKKTIVGIKSLFDLNDNVIILELHTKNSIEYFKLSLEEILDE